MQSPVTGDPLESSDARLSAGGTADPAPDAANLLPYLLSLGMTLLFYLPLLFPGNRLDMGGDYTNYYQSVRAFANDALRRGRLPEWCEATFGGYPFIGDPQSGVFFLPHLITALFTDSIRQAGAMDLLVLSQCILLSLGAVFLARGLVMGTAASCVVSAAMTFGGFTVSHLGHFSMVEVTAAGLWGLGFLVRSLRAGSWQHAAAGGLCLSQAVLPGHPHLFLMILYAAAFAATFKTIGAYARSGLRGASVPVCLFLLCVTIAAAGSMVQILPTREYLASTSRRSLDLEAALMSQVPVHLLPGLWFPRLYTLFDGIVPADSDETVLNWSGVSVLESLNHFGMALSVLAVAGWLFRWRCARTQALFWSTVILLVASLGDQAGLYPLLFKFVPGFQQVRVPGRLLFLATLGLSLLAGLGLDSLVSRAASSRVRRTTSALIALLAAGATAAVAIVVLTRYSDGSWHGAFSRLLVFSPETPDADLFVRNVGWQLLAALATVGLAALWLAAVGSGRFSARHLRTCGALLVLGELALYGVGVNVGPSFIRSERIPPADLSDYSPWLAFSSPPQGRVVTQFAPRNFCAGIAVSSGIALTGGYNPLIADWVQLMKPVENLASSTLFNLWNVSHVLMPRRDFSLQIAGKTLSLPDVGWITVGDSIHWSPQATLPVAPQTKVRRIHLLASCNQEASDRTTDFSLSPAAVLEFCDHRGLALTTVPLRLSREFGAPWPAASSSPSATLTPTVFQMSDHDAEDAAFYLSSWTVPEEVAERLSSVRLVSGHLFITSVFASYLFLEDKDAAVTSLPWVEAHGYRETASRQAKWRVLENTRPRTGYAWMVARSEPPGGADTSRSGGSDALAGFRIRTRLSEPGFPLDRIVVVEKSSPAEEALQRYDALNPESYSGRCEVRSERPEKLRIESDSTQNGWLVLSRTYDKGWSARVDGEPVPVRRANGVFMTVPVPAGKHVTTFDYRTPGLRLGAWISCFVWGGVLGALGVSAMATRKGSKVSA